MKLNELLQIILFFGLGIALTPVLGRFMARVFKGEKTFLHPLLFPVEKLVYRLTGIDPTEEMSWLKYLWAVVIMATRRLRLLMADPHDPEVAAAESRRAWTIFRGTWRSTPRGASPATPTGSPTPARRR